MNFSERTSHTHKNRKAVVTGGSTGIGSSIVKKLSEADIKTAIVDMRIPAEEHEHFFSVDLRQAEQINDFCHKLISDFGIPDILVLNAGRGIHEKLTEGDPVLWEEIFQLNIFSSLRLIRAFVPEMMKKGSGDIVFISSVAARQAFPYGGIYGASKAAVDMIAETLRLEVQPVLRVTTLHPGVVDSHFFDNMIHGYQTVESIGWGALKPAEVADAVLFAINQPTGVALNDIVIRPVAQPL